MEDDENDIGDLEFFWTRPIVKPKKTDLLTDLYKKGRKILDLKVSDYLRAEQMAEEMKIPIGLVFGQAGVRLMAKCRRKDPKKELPIERELFKIHKALVGREENRSVEIVAPQLFITDLDVYVIAMKETFGEFSYQAYYKKAIDDFWLYRDKTAESAARRREMSDDGKGGANAPEKKE